MTTERNPVVEAILEDGVLTHLVTENNEHEMVKSEVASPGIVRTIAIPFAFDTPGLDVGVEIYTPKVGDLLLDATFFVTEQFDGTTPRADLGVTDGLFLAWNWSTPDYVLLDGMLVSLAGGLQFPSGAPERAASLGAAIAFYNTMSLTLPDPPTAGASFDTNNAQGYATTHRFVSTDPLLLWATQDGLIGGEPIDSTEGAGTLVLMVSTPELVTL